MPPAFAFLVAAPPFLCQLIITQGAQPSQLSLSQICKSFLLGKGHESYAQPCECWLYPTSLLSSSYYSEKFIVYLVASSSELRPEQRGKCCVSALGVLGVGCLSLPLVDTGFLSGCCLLPAPALSMDLRPLTK